MSPKPRYEIRTRGKRGKIGFSFLQEAIDHGYITESNSEIYDRQENRVIARRYREERKQTSLACFRAETVGAYENVFGWEFVDTQERIPDIVDKWHSPVFMGPSGVVNSYRRIGDTWYSEHGDAIL